MLLCGANLALYCVPSDTEPKQRGIVERDDGEAETRLRGSPTESANESDFILGLDGWIYNDVNVIILESVTLENGSEFVLIQYEYKCTTREGTPTKPVNRTVRGWLRSKYVRKLSSGQVRDMLRDAYAAM